MRTTDVDAVPSSGLSFYFPAAADAAATDLAVFSAATPITDAATASSGLSSCCAAAEMAMAIAAVDADANLSN